ncbi:MAG TPA: FliH/SctL family protein [Alphaproteobacteria bacterium]|nr:hypothetical protein [Rhodospirillaceae bacterium]HRJ11653.1 FliH/SctL family protein [Alphaproteobacteria bacterium]
MTKPFLFDNRDFDELAEANGLSPEERPQFSQLDMEAAVSSAQQRGFEEGLSSAVQSEEAKTTRLLEKIMGGIADLHAAKAQRDADAQSMAIEVASGLLRKLMPELAIHPSLEGVSELVRQVMMDRFEEPRLIIRVHDSVLDGLNERLQSLAQQSGFRGQYALMADTSLSPPDCRIEWSNGGAERSVVRLWDDMHISLAQIQAALDGKAAEPLQHMQVAAAETKIDAAAKPEATIEEVLSQEPMNAENPNESEPS